MINLTLVFNNLLRVEFILAFLVFILLNFISAPYGRFERKGWGKSVNSRISWIIMEMPAFIIPIFLFFLSGFSIVSFMFLIIWQTHYFHRTLIYPFRIYNSPKSFSWLIIIWGGLFNILNSFVNFLFLFFIEDNKTVQWFSSWKFILGIIIFITGYVINKKSDAQLRHLRLNNKSEYSIPSGGLYNWISSPNYLGEIIEWGGWAILTWSFAGFTFFLFTVANLLPRAIMVHKWYKNSFNEYPEKRKALLPFLL